MESIKIPTAFPYVRATPSNPPPPIKSPAVSHYIPLSNGASPSLGPQRSVFSAPQKFIYSPDTKKMLDEFSRESKLTFTQKQGLQGILRQGKPLPSSPMDIYRQEMFRHRHAEKARGAFGMNLAPPMFNPPEMSHSAQMYFKFGRGGRRPGDTIQREIKREKMLSHTQGPRRFYGVDKEREKDLLAHRMANGKGEPMPEKNLMRVTGIQPNKPRRKEEGDEETEGSFFERRFMELVGELRERVEFLDGMRILGKEATYRDTIAHQTSEVLQQMRQISPEMTKEWTELLDLENRVFRPKRPRDVTQIQTVLTRDD